MFLIGGLDLVDIHLYRRKKILEELEARRVILAENFDGISHFHILLNTFTFCPHHHQPT